MVNNMQHFEPGQPIICRYSNNAVWNYNIYNRPSDAYSNMHITIDNVPIKDENILPFNEKTQHLVGKYINYTEYEPEPNTVIAVRHNEKHSWKYRKFVYKDANKYACIVEDDENEIHLWDFATSIEESIKD